MYSIKVNKQKIIGVVEKEIFGSFVEHLGRSVYNGIYQPSHPESDEMGFRNDVIEAIKELNVSIIRYPGGNFVSGYDWKEGVGDKSKRKQLVDLAWCEIEPNLVGVDEFAYFSKKVNSEIMMAVNLGTGPIQDVSDLVQYCNLKDEGYWANYRIANGYNTPHNIKVWCLGNEMDGDWQICSKTAEDYAKIAKDAAKIIKWVSPNCKVVACGSCSPLSKTFPSWDKTVVHQIFDYIDYLSLHAYYTYPTKDHDVKEFFGSGKNFDNYIKTVKQLVLKEKKKRKSNKEIYLSVDEWNVWHTFDGSNKRVKDWTYGSPLLENHYDFADCLVFASLLITILNNCDYVKIGCLAQLVNVIAPILTDDEKGVLKQTTFYPFSILSNEFRGLKVLDCKDNYPMYNTKTYKKVNSVYKCVAYDEIKNEYKIALVNVSGNDANSRIVFDNDVKIVKCCEMADANLHDKNTFEEPNKVVLKEVEVFSNEGNSFNLKLKKYSFSVITFKKIRKEC